MARARNIKPSFFTNDKLADCEPMARLLFIGLWTIADREGRLEDNARKIKALVFPYDNCDCESLLNQLADKDFIIRYEIEFIPYIQIVNFRKHQHPHIKEGASLIPAPDSHHTSTVQNRPLIESPILNPESPNPTMLDNFPSEEISFEFEVIGKNLGLNKKEVETEYILFRNNYLAKPNDKITTYKPLWQSWCINSKGKYGAHKPTTQKGYDRPKKEIKPAAGNLADPAYVAKLKAEGAL